MNDVTILNFNNKPMLNKINQIVFSSKLRLFAFSTLLRVILLIWSQFQDAYSEVPYTDVDYKVVTDAAKYLLEGESPYLRATYRYTPLLAYLVAPNHLVHQSFGKWLFSISDLLCGYLLIQLGEIRETSKLKVNQIVGTSWLLNPFVATISTRGNCESVLILMILSSLYSFLKNHFIWGCILFGLSVQFKLYPVIYAVSILGILDRHYPREFLRLKCLGKRVVSHGAGRQTRSRFKIKNLNPVNVIIKLLKFIIPRKYHHVINTTRVELFVYSAATFFLLNIFFYLQFGNDFVNHTYWYHLIRKDHRHNFSIWFLPLYLTYNDPTASGLTGLLSFAPQLLVVLTWGLGLKRDIQLNWFCQTFLFVAFNKVSTSQYFIWYLALLPLVLMQLDAKAVRPVVLGALSWIISQAAWLFCAYLLEFQSKDTFVPIWFASVWFFLSHILLVKKFIKYYQLLPTFIDGKLVKLIK